MEEKQKEMKGETIKKQRYKSKNKEEKKKMG